ncbi:MAG: MmgE/PrpD family protein [Rhodospirillaceae bacterium]|nr:MmgE/PrpD family protein [Rhodospirillaceae bacterium]
MVNPSASRPADQPGALSRCLASFAAETRWEDIPESVRHEAKRSLLNYFATALGGSNEPALDKNLAVMQKYSGAQDCGIIGRRERGDMLLAASSNAMIANIFDYDDTHPNTIIHPTAPIAPALFAFAEAEGCSGQSLLRAFILGGEIECRIGNAVSPSHYSRGWHITSTCGVFGSAVGIGALLGLSAEAFVWALGNASAQASGLVETLGTDAKSLSMGNATKNGITSSLLAAEGFAGPAAPLEGRHGFVPVFSDTQNLIALSEGLGDTWEIAKNTYKPYPVGVVLNPIVDACLELHQRGVIKVEDVLDVELTGHPLLRQRTDRPDVTTGRSSQVSAQHAIAIVLRRGQASLEEFNDEAVAETSRDAIRPDIRFVDDDRYDIEAARVVVRTHQGKTHAIDVTAAKGGPGNPMTDAGLEDKLVTLAGHCGFDREVGPIIDAVWALEGTPDAAAVMRLVTR